MATQLEIVRLIGPEFSAISDVDVQKFLDMAPLFIDVLRLPIDNQGLALSLKACSLMSDKQASADGMSHGGVIASEKEGDLSRSFSFGSTHNGFKVKNNYEQQLDLLYMSAGGNIMTRF